MMQHPSMIDVTRRHFFARTFTGIGIAALGSLLSQNVADASTGLDTFPSHPPKAKRVIYLYMSGGPSQFESFDDKPMLRELNGKPIPKSLTAGVKLAFLQYEALKCFGTDVGFKKCGESGQSISNLFPHLQKLADELCVVRTLQTDQVNHDPAHTFMNTGFGIPGRPSMGSWLSYGLGSDAADLPDFVVMRSGPLGQPIPTTAWHNGFLPGKHQGVEFYGSEQPLNFLASPAGVNSLTQRQTIESIESLNKLHYDDTADQEIITRINQYELAFQMQTSVPDLADFASESQATRDLYGVGDKPDGSFASNCLMARRMAERGVRFTQIFHRGWDQHGTLPKDLPNQCRDVDQPSAGLLTNLKQRGMLNYKLVIWGGEFGRTIYCQG